MFSKAKKTWYNLLLLFSLVPLITDDLLDTAKHRIIQ